MKRIVFLPVFTVSAVLCLTLSSAAISAGFTSSASSTGASAASAGSNSLRASSGAISTSSTSASGEGDVAAGQYRLAAMQSGGPADDQLATIRLALAPVNTDAGGFPFELEVPKQALASHDLKPGDIIYVARESFGLEFAHGNEQRTFFLVLADEWEQNLGTFQLKR
ncbi:MAG: hypothetical protein AB8C46_00655 [Burkholderiaceae bacterium]